MEMRFDRRELAGSLGDLGTILPLALGLILVNGLDATAIFLTMGLFYVLSGLYFGVTVPVEPMKVIGAYAIASSLAPARVSAACLWMAVLLLVLGLSGAMSLVRRIVPPSTVRGVQLGTGVLLFIQGIKYMLGQSALQKAQGSAEPFLSVVSFGPVPVGIVLGLGAVVIILLLLENRVVPAALAVVAAGLVAGLALGGHRQLAGFHLGLHVPPLLPFGWPSGSELAVALTALALPQLPMTLGNAVVAQADLTHEYFGAPASARSTHKAFALSMGLANAVVWLFGGMPLCHGSGGLAAHYRFGARTAGSNLMIGGIFLVIGLLLGDRAVALFSLLPFAVLGALLCFAGAQLALMILDVKAREDLFVVITMLAVSLVTNLGVGFGVGVLLAYLFRYTPMKI